MIPTQYSIIMTLSKTGPAELTTEEWKELNALREAINYNPHTVSPKKMEKFTELFVRSLEGKGDIYRNAI
jgi:DNA-binding MarR family transcriptional regulator